MDLPTPCSDDSVHLADIMIFVKTLVNVDQF